MTIRKKEERTGPVVIDISGPDGNAFALMGFASSFARQMGKDVKPIIEEMKSGDYEHLLEVFDKHFGHVVTLER